jgi:hypothetical protein
MNKKIKALIFFASLVSGFALALLAAKIHSSFFILLPVLAFLSGYFTSWLTGLICGLLLFAGYTFTIALMWEVRYALVGFPQYIMAFIFGGFSILLVGATAPVIKRGLKNPGAIVTLAIFIATMAGCTYISIPKYQYSFELMILCDQDMELYLPAEKAGNDFGEKLIITIVDAQPTFRDWSDIHLKETEYGQMWNLKLTSYLEPGVTPEGKQILGRSSNWYRQSSKIRSWPGISPVEMVVTEPKSNIHEINITEPETIAWPAFITADKKLAGFNIPLKVITATPTKFDIYMFYSVSKKSGLNFGYNKDEGYSEIVDHYSGTTGNDWVLVPASSTHSISIRGIGD